MPDIGGVAVACHQSGYSGQIRPLSTGMSVAADACVAFLGGMNMKLRVIWDLLKDTVYEWNEDKAPRLGAALAYYSIFSIAPLLILVIAIASLIFGEKAAQGAIVREIEGTVGEPVAKAIEFLLQQAHQEGGGVTATVIGAVTLLFGAAGVFGQLQDALNTIWKVKPKPGRAWLAMIKERVLPFVVVLGT